MKNIPYKVSYHKFACQSSGGKEGYAFCYKGEGTAPHWPMTFDTVSEGVDHIQRYYGIKPEFSSVERM